MSPRAERYRRMTPEQLEVKWDRQRRQRLTRPAINGRLRTLFDSTDEYYELYNELYERQDGRCGICLKTSDRKFHMDHNHKTLEIRGLLCFSCNSKLGFVEKYLGAIMSYLGYEVI